MTFMFYIAHISVEEGAAGGMGQLLGFVPLAWGGTGVVEGMLPQGTVRLMATPTHVYLHMKNSIAVVSCKYKPHIYHNSVSRYLL